MRTATRTTPPDRPSTDDTSGRDGAAGRAGTLLGRLGGWCFDHRFTAVGLWLLMLVVLLGAAGAVGPAFGASGEVPDSGSTRGLRVLEEHFPEMGAGNWSGTIVFRADQGVDDPEIRATMEGLFTQVDEGFPDGDGTVRHPGATVVSPYSDAGREQIARDGPLAGQVAYATVHLAAELDEGEAGAIGAAILDHEPAVDGLEVLTGGQYLAEVEPPQTELIGVAFAVVVLILAFGSVLAMGLPIAVAAGGVAAGAAGILLLTNVFAVPEDANLLGMMIGLGVGIDYALFIVTRFREGLHQGISPREATATAMGSAGRAVIFAGMTVVISMLGLLLVGIDSVGGMGIGVSVTVLATMCTSVTLLPALLGLAGHRVELTRWRGLIAAGAAALALLGLGIGSAPLAGVGVVGAVLVLLASTVVRPLRWEVPRRAPRAVRETVAYRWSRTIQRKPLLWLLAAAAVLLVLAAPVTTMRLGWADEGNFPSGTSTRQAYDLLGDAFGEGFNGPLLVTAVPGPDDPPQAMDQLQETLAQTAGVAEATPAVPDDPADPRAYVMTVVPTTAPQDEATIDLVSSLRRDVIPAAVDGTQLEVNVTGTAATNIDVTDYLSERMVIFFGAVLLLSFVLLMAVFRSLLVAIKAVIMNVTSIAAAYGVVVVVFQWGWGGQLLGIEGGPINPYVPMMLFAIVFGLSMDYEVFMLSRIREEYSRTGDSANAVADGLASTARVITAAAAIMVVVFGSFALEDIREIKLFGLGLALAVFLDATLVRLLVVPATMELLGDRNWWIPRWLDRILPRLDVEGSNSPRPAGEQM